MSDFVMAYTEIDPQVILAIWASVTNETLDGSKLFVLQGKRRFCHGGCFESPRVYNHFIYSSHTV